MSILVNWLPIVAMYSLVLNMKSTETTDLLLDKIWKNTKKYELND